MNLTTRRNLFALAAGALASAVGAPTAFAEIIIQERIMPELRIETRPPPPHPGWYWVRGHWKYEGSDWAWIPGRYVPNRVPEMPEIIVETPPPPPTPRHFWVRGHWVWERTHWAWIRGHWVV